jgi:hypothetical protein
MLPLVHPYPCLSFARVSFCPIVTSLHSIYKKRQGG